MAGEGDGGCSEGHNKASLKAKGSPKGSQVVPKRVKEISSEEDSNSRDTFGFNLPQQKAHILETDLSAPLLKIIEMPRGATALWMGELGVKKER